MGRVDRSAYHRQWFLNYVRSGAHVLDLARYDTLPFIFGRAGHPWGCGAHLACRSRR